MHWTGKHLPRYSASQPPRQPQRVPTSNRIVVLLSAAAVLAAMTGISQAVADTSSAHPASAAAAVSSAGPAAPNTPSTPAASTPTANAAPSGVPSAQPSTPAPIARAVVLPGATEAGKMPVTIDNSPIPALAVLAYKKAATKAPCTIGWYLLAGIGKIESNHGRFGGARFTTTGDVVPAIQGPPTYLAGARAQGPMQFMPTTWVSWGADGNSDGTADPQNEFDATRSAADYLCADAADLTVAANARRAVFSYNHLDSYVTDVMAYATAYRTHTSVVTLVPITAPKPTPKPTATTTKPGPPTSPTKAKPKPPVKPKPTPAKPTASTKPKPTASTTEPTPAKPSAPFPTPTSPAPAKPTPTCPSLKPTGATQTTPAPARPTQTTPAPARPAPTCPSSSTSSSTAPTAPPSSPTQQVSMPQTSGASNR